jgi:hypothetical protein
MKTYYNRRTWLNKENSPSNGNVVAFDGMRKDYDGKEYRSTNLSIGDCHEWVRLHKTEDDTMDDFIDKMELLKNEIQLFIEHLKNKQIELKYKT